MDAAARAEADDELSDEREELDEALADGDMDADEHRDAMTYLDTLAIVTGADGDIPGDGLAAVWFFVYYSPEQADPFLAAVSRGHVVLDGSDSDLADHADLGDLGSPLGDWMVDSDDAAAAAALGSDDYKGLCAGSNVMAFTTLSFQDNAPVWLLGVESQDDDGGEAFLAVSALNGSLVQDQVDTPADVVMTLWQESGEDAGNVVAGAAQTQTTSFNVQLDGHAGLAFLAGANGVLVQPMTFAVIDPAGTRTETTLSVDHNEGSFVLGSVPKGTYQVEVTSALAPFASWRIAFCTDGAEQEEPEGYAADACDALEEATGGLDATLTGETLSRLAPWVRAWPN
jgi:hypothetical protein